MANVREGKGRGRKWIDLTVPRTPKNDGVSSRASSRGRLYLGQQNRVCRKSVYQLQLM
jgi:hypothetical protein